MREPYVDALLSLGIDPTAKDATVWKRESVHAVITDDGKFKIAVKWSNGAASWLRKYRAVSGYQIDLDQSDEKGAVTRRLALKPGGNAKVLFLHLIDAPREGKA